MSSFGDKLRTEREARGLSVETVAAALGVEPDQVQALEGDDYAAMPDDATLLASLHAYAVCLEVDAELMIADYVREREAALQVLAAALPDQAASHAPEPPLAVLDAVLPDQAASRVAEPPSSSRFARWAIPAAIVVALGSLGAWWLMSKPAKRVVSPTVETRPTPNALESRQTVPEAPPAEPHAAAVRAPAPAEAGAVLHLADHGVGSAVRNHELVGRSNRFRVGSQVWFFTHVAGGRPGDEIEHVWLHEGVEAGRTRLAVRGASFRTYSTRTLRAAGHWAVEAQDRAGHVLGRSEFVCVR